MVDASLEGRGGQVQTLLLLRGLRDLGHLVELAAPPDGWLAACLESVFPMPSGQGLRQALALRRHVRSFQPEIVAAQSSHAHGDCVLSGLRPVVHRRVDFRPLPHPLQRLKYARARLYVAVSEAVAAVLRAAGVPSGRIRVVHDGVPAMELASPASDLSGEGALLGAIGALVEHKGHRYLLDALSELPGLRCVIVGEGPLRASLQRRIGELGLESRVRLVGHREDIPAVLAALDLLVQPSVEEGMGQVVIEAMAAGVPVLTTSAGGLPEVLGTGRSLCEPRDSRGLALAIRRALSERGGEVQVLEVEDARRRAREHFSVDRMVRETLVAYESALNEPLSGGG